MTDNVQHLMLDILKKLQTELSATRVDVREIKTRVGSLETMMGRLTRDHAHIIGEQIEDRHAVDRLRDRIERLERRLELND